MNISAAEAGQQIADPGPAHRSGLTAWLQRHWRLILLSAVGWTLLAAIPTTSAYLGSGAGDPSLWWAMFRKIGIYYYLWGLLSPLLYRLTNELPMRGPGLALTVATHLVTLTVLSFALGAITHHEAWHEWLLGQRAVAYHAMSTFTYVLIVICCLAVRFYRTSLLNERLARDARLLAAQLDSKLNMARVDSLRMQMNPHFMFNALNSVGALIETSQQDAAYEAVEELGSLLRQALSLSRKSEVPLAEEIEFARAYLALEQIRFGERMAVRWQIEPETLSVPVPAFILQPLVENAIKHAVGKSRRTVTITLRAQLRGEALVLDVTDDGNGSKERVNDTGNSGVGLANLEERLRLRYGPESSCRVDRTPGNFTTELRIPYQAGPSVAQ